MLIVGQLKFQKIIEDRFEKTMPPKKRVHIGRDTIEAKRRRKFRENQSKEATTKTNKSRRTEYRNREQPREALRFESFNKTDDNCITSNLQHSKNEQVNLIIKSEPSESIENIFIKEEIVDDQIDISTVKIESRDDGSIDPLALGNIETNNVNTKHDFLPIDTF